MVFPDRFPGLKERNTQFRRRNGPPLPPSSRVRFRSEMQPEMFEFLPEWSVVAPWTVHLSCATRRAALTVLMPASRGRFGAQDDGGSDVVEGRGVQRFGGRAA